MTKTSFGVIGLGVMGRNLAFNIERNGYPVVGYDLSSPTRDTFQQQVAGRQITVAATLPDLITALPHPRKILIMIPAGAPVDSAIAQLTPLLQAGDVLIDGGNSYFVDTERRSDALAEMGLHFIGLGVSGGAEGALHGPSMMAGGDPNAYALIADILTAMAARADDGEPCVAHLGPRGAGHYVKMVHNGIEYGDMQLIAEAYDLLHRGLGLGNDDLHQVFSEWNEGVLSSYLIAITADIFTHVDEETQRPLLDLILDRAAQKGTGKWTSQEALDVGTATPTLTAAVNGRLLSAVKEERLQAAQRFTPPNTSFSGDKEAMITAVGEALYAAKICAYAQGMALLQAASVEYAYQLDLTAVARVWRAGCIIRAIMLDDIAHAFTRQPDLPNLLLDDFFAEALAERQAALRQVVITATQLGIPIPAMMASLSYFDSYRNGRLPANLIQAQRDYFGAHTFERIDKPGSFHHDWDKQTD